MIVVMGLVRFLFMMLNVVLWIGLNREGEVWVGLREVEWVILIELESLVVRLDKMLRIVLSCKIIYC